MTDPIHRLLGCEWGVLMSLPDDEQPCPEIATRRVMVHDPYGAVDGADRLMQLCPKHMSRLLEETTPSAPEATE